LKFDDEMFFTFILPPIIFAAGYNLRRRSFFKYFLYIFLFGVLGTVITFLVVLPLTYFANSNQLFRVTTSNIDLNEQNSSISRHLSEIYNDTTGYDNETILDTPETPSYILDFSINEILLFSSVISATDTVAALTFIKEEQEPKLFAILFGEGVINDAVCIVLYGILREFTSSNESIYN
jgi:NhaP-type Na+/H+ or K+/H+ antiporter